MKRTGFDVWLVVAAGVLVTFLAASGVVYARLSTAEHSSELAQFKRQSDTRHARVLGELATKQFSLQTSAAFFGSSSNVSADEFRSFHDVQAVSGQLTAACFHAASEDQVMASPPGAGEALCAHYDPLEPSRVVMSETPVLMLSSFVENETQRGTISIVFALDSLFLAESPVNMREFLVVTNSMANVAATYRLDRELGVIRSVDGLDQAHAYRAYDVCAVGGVSFVYVAEPIPARGTGTVALIVSLILAGLGVLASVLFVNLARTRRVVEREVRERTAELSQFAYRTSHDLSGPLISVAALCRATREDIEDGFDDDVLLNLTRIEEQVERLRTVVTDVLDLTQASEELPSESIDAADVVRQMAAAAADAFPGNRVTINLSDVPDEALVVVSQTRLSRVVENLVSNAIKYADPDRAVQVVDVTLRTSSRELQLVVKDNGLGIRRADQPKLFDMFTRFHASAGDGSGLGLSIVQRHIAHMGGTITVTSAPGQGTAFHVNIPT